MKRIEREIDAALETVEEQLQDKMVEARSDGTMWDWSYSLGKRNGIRLAREIVTGQSRDHDSPTFGPPPSEEDE